jgi:AcrR family transcriptional regulator
VAYRRTERVKQRLAARHEAIVDAAADLAAEQGMNAVQIAPVAARADIAAGTVYRYFQSKTDLVAAVIKAVSKHELAAMRLAGDAAPGPLSALAATIVTFGARALEARKLAWAVIAEPVDAEIDQLRLAYRKALAAEIEARLRAAIASGQVPDQDAAVAAPAIIGALLEGLIGPLASDVGDDAARAREAVQTLTLVALRAVGVADARARGLVVQAAMPSPVNAP